MANVETSDNSQHSKPKILVGLALAAGFVALAGLVFALVRRLQWSLGWTYVGIFVATMTINLVCVLRWNPVLIGRRSRFGKGTKTWDVVWLVLFGIVVIAVFVVAGLEPPSEVSPGAAWLLGLAVFMAGWALATWSMVVNPFFEKTVRIQTEQGHRVIDTGPYAYVRHPGYVGFIGWMISTPLMLASAWAWVPAALAVAAFVIRTELEDRMLRAELPGYVDYAARVRFRLIPGVW